MTCVCVLECEWVCDIDVSAYSAISTTKPPTCKKYVSFTPDSEHNYHRGLFCLGSLGQEMKHEMNSASSSRPAGFEPCQHNDWGRCQDAGLLLILSCFSWCLITLSGYTAGNYASRPWPSILCHLNELYSLHARCTDHNNESLLSSRGIDKDIRGDRVQGVILYSNNLCLGEVNLKNVP